MARTTTVLCYKYFKFFFVKFTSNQYINAIFEKHLFLITDVICIIKIIAIKIYICNKCKNIVIKKNHSSRKHHIIKKKKFNFRI